jgi:hypothetical protein
VKENEFEELQHTLATLPDEQKRQLLLQLLAAQAPELASLFKFKLATEGVIVSVESRVAELIEPPYTPVHLGGLWEGEKISHDDLAALAADPQVQAELRQIAAEFAVTEHDGLDRKPDGN